MKQTSLATTINLKICINNILSATVFISSLLGASLSHADTFIFNDLSDGIPTVTHFGSEASITTFCQLEGCTTLISHINGATTTTYPPVIIAASEPGFPNLASDAVELFDNRGQKGQEVVFNSFHELSQPTCVSVAGNAGCQLVENGAVQTAVTLTWSDGSTDLIQFQSSVSPVPLPASIWLFSTGLAGLGFWRKRARAFSS